MSEISNRTHGTCPGPDEGEKDSLNSPPSNIVNFAIERQNLDCSLGKNECKEPNVTPVCISPKNHEQIFQKSPNDKLTGDRCDSHCISRDTAKIDSMENNVFDESDISSNSHEEEYCNEICSERATSKRKYSDSDEDMMIVDEIEDNADDEPTSCAYEQENPLTVSASVEDNAVSENSFISCDQPAATAENISAESHTITSKKSLETIVSASISSEIKPFSIQPTTSEETAIIQNLDETLFNEKQLKGDDSVTDKLSNGSSIHLDHSESVNKPIIKHTIETGITSKNAVDVSVINKPGDGSNVENTAIVINEPIEIGNLAVKLDEQPNSPINIEESSSDPIVGSPPAELLIESKINSPPDKPVASDSSLNEVDTKVNLNKPIQQESNVPITGGKHIQPVLVENLSELIVSKSSDDASCEQFNEHEILSKPLTELEINSKRVDEIIPKVLTDSVAVNEPAKVDIGNFELCKNAVDTDRPFKNLVMTDESQDEILKESMVPSKTLQEPVVHHEPLKEVLSPENVSIETGTVPDKCLKEPIAVSEPFKVPMVPDKPFKKPMVPSKPFKKPVMPKNPFKEPMVPDKSFKKPILPPKSLKKSVILNKSFKEPVVVDKHFVKPVMTDKPFKVATPVNKPLNELTILDKSLEEPMIEDTSTTVDSMNKDIQIVESINVDAQIAESINECISLVESKHAELTILESMNKNLQVVESLNEDTSTNEPMIVDSPVTEPIIVNTAMAEPTIDNTSMTEPMVVDEPMIVDKPDNEPAVTVNHINDSTSVDGAVDSSKPDEITDDEPIGFPPENLFEYMWPSEKGEFYILQEQISDYLNVKSFKRKYPDLSRRTVDYDEKIFLKERGIVTETQCDLGLTALKSDDVMELMNKDYPDKYNAYIKVLREKERKTISEKHKEYANSVDKNKIIEVAKKAAKSAAEYNANLNQERKEERRCCFDLQTFTIHYPVGRRKRNEGSKMGKYPVALLPGQFQDSFKIYTPEELKYMPLNTVLYGPLQEIKSVIPSDGSDSDDSSGSEGSCSSSQGTHDDNSGESSSGSEKNEKSLNKSAVTNNSTNEKPTFKNVLPNKGKEKPISICKVCRLPGGTLNDNKTEPLIQCSVCRSNGHPKCLGLTLEMVSVLKTYPWQCMDCKTCVHCNDPYDEDKMLFCDICDRGYHTFCVGLKLLPPGKWICAMCGHCSVCNATQPGPDGTKAQWQYDVIDTSNSDSSQRPQVVCEACSKQKQ